MVRSRRVDFCTGSSRSRVGGRIQDRVDGGRARGVGCQSPRGHKSDRYMENGAVRAVLGDNNGNRASRVTGDWLSSTSGVGTSESSRSFSVGGTGISVRGASGGAQDISGGLCQRLGF